MVDTNTTAINKNESAEGIQITELEREPQLQASETGSIKATPRAAQVDRSAPPVNKDKAEKILASHPEAPKSDELEALWPGVQHQDIMHMHPVKRTPSFYIMMGFIGGAIVSLLGVWGVSMTSQQVTANNKTDNSILVAKADKLDTSSNPMTAKNVDPNAELVPISESYVVKSGDTLVSIALKNYRKVTPRLIDSIVEQNNLKNANVLNLGQKLTLPTYQQPARKMAATSQGQVH